MKKLLLLVSTLILAACSGGADVGKELNAKITEGNTDYRISVSYEKLDKVEATDEYTFIASEKAFDVNSTIVEGSETITITYKTFEDGDRVENLKAIDNNGDEYDVDVETYSDIMKDQVMFELDFISDVTTGIYENVSDSDTETSYIYVVKNTAQKDTFELYKDISGFESVIEKLSVSGKEKATTVLEFL